MMGGTEQLATRTAASEAEERARIRDVLANVARPRLCGSEGAQHVDEYIRGELTRLGYEVRELPFTFSATPGRWAVPAAGVLLILTGVSSSALAAGHHGLTALVVLVLAVFLLALAATKAAAAIQSLPWERMQGINWLASRPGARPRYVLAAHRDSKSQAVPLIARAAAIGGGIVAILALLLLDLVALLGPDRWHLGVPALLIAVACAAAGATLAACIVRNDSPGALDNASGVAALLALAARERESLDVAFLLTDAEELGLAGASAVSRRLPPTIHVINLDGLDDGGGFHVIERHGFPPRGLAPNLVAALLGAAHRLGFQAQRRTLPVGVLADHIPFLEAGIAAVTVMRGTPESLRRVHLAADDTSRLTGEGVAQTAALVAEALALLRAKGVA